MGSPGFFDSGLRKEGWFDGTALPEGWFDPLLVPAEGGSIPSAPNPPVLAATAGDGQVSLNWSAPAGALSYKLYRSLVSGVYGAALATGILDVSYADSDVVNGVTYYYKVLATNGVGDSNDSNEVSATPTAVAVVVPIPTGGVNPHRGGGHVHGPPIRANLIEEELVVHQAVQLSALVTVEIPLAILFKDSLAGALEGGLALEKSFGSRLRQAVRGGLGTGLALQKSFGLSVDPKPQLSIRTKLRAHNLAQDDALIRQMMLDAGEEIPL